MTKTHNIRSYTRADFVLIQEALVEKRVVIQVLAVGQPVILTVDNVSYFVGCKDDGATDKETVGILSLRHCETGKIRFCDDVERTVVRDAIVCCSDDRAGTLPTFRHERKENETWWQMIVNSMPIS